MKNQKQTIRKIIGFLNNPEDDGGFWLPNIQRPFVWGDEQICRLFDSILREYPISTLLVWKTKSEIRHRKFIDNWTASIKLSDFFIPENERKKYLVLDGQQRLQSLFIGLRGSFAGKELYFDVMSGESSSSDDIKYKFDFKKSNPKFPWIKFKDLVLTDSRKKDHINNIAKKIGRALNDDEKERIEENLDLIEPT